MSHSCPTWNLYIECLLHRVSNLSTCDVTLSSIKFTLKNHTVKLPKKEIS